MKGMVVKLGKKIPIVAIVGPTATGKTALSIELAKHYNGEIISCDSMQIYKGLDIGTAKPTEDELSQATHHLIGFADIEQNFSVSDYVGVASKKIETIFNRGKKSILVGGTGLYARSLLTGLSFEDNSRDERIRESLEKKAEENGENFLYDKLREIDSEAASKIHPNNLKRVIRALEYFECTGEKFSVQAENSKEIESNFNYVMVCLAFRDRQKLYDRINSRVDKMMEMGLLEEAKTFYEQVSSMKQTPTAAQAIGYKELFPFFTGEVSLVDAVDKLKMETRRYAKRQLTWFKKEKNINFIYLDDFDFLDEVLNEIIKIIDNSEIFAS